MVFELTSKKSLEEIDRGLREAAARHSFGVIAVHDLKATMKKKGVDYGDECVIYEICNPQQAKRALEANAAVSAALPCRISVYRSGDALRLSTILPSVMLKLFQTPALEAVGQEVEESITAMMRESA